MKRLIAIPLAVVVLAGVGWLAWQRIAADTAPGRLYGNVEIRQVDLAFNSEGTVTSMPKHEGDPVHSGRSDRATRRCDLSRGDGSRRGAARCGEGGAR